AAADATAAALAPSSRSWHPEPDGAVRTPPKAPVRFSHLPSFSSTSRFDHDPFAHADPPWTPFPDSAAEMRSKLLQDAIGILDPCCTGRGPAPCRPGNGRSRRSDENFDRRGQSHP